MRSALWFSVVCAVLVPCLCKDSMHSSCASDDGGDDRCEFIQSSVGVVSQHTSHHENEGWPDILKDVTKILSGSTVLKKDAELFQAEVEAFAKVVKETPNNLVKSVKSSMKLKEVITKVDAAGHTIWVALKKVLDALTKVGDDFDTGVGKAIPSGSFKSHLDESIKSIKAEGDKIGIQIDMKLSSVNIASVCDEAKKRLDSFKSEADKFAKGISGITTEGMKKEVADLYEALPDDAQKEFDKFLKKANAAGSNFMETASTAGKEIYNSIGMALKGHCPNFATFQSLAAQLKFGLVTAITVSAVALTV